MSGLKWFFEQYLQLPRWERIANIVLLMSIFLLVIVINVWPDAKIDDVRMYRQTTFAQQLQKAHDSVVIERILQKHKQFKQNIKHDSVFYIHNLRTANVELLQKAGLSKRVAMNVFKYVQKGGRIRTKQDVQKIYGMTPAMANAFVNHLVFDTSQLAKQHSVKPNNFLVDINTADTVELKKIRGIGSKLAKNIVAYRLLVGKYNSVEQLREVRGMFPENYAQIVSFVRVNHFEPFISINTIDAKELKKHVYFRKNNLAQILIAYRNKHGKFKTIADVRKCKAVSDESIKKITPYLLFD